MLCVPAEATWARLWDSAWSSLTMQRTWVTFSVVAEHRHAREQGEVGQSLHVRLFMCSQSRKSLPDQLQQTAERFYKRRLIINCLCSCPIFQPHFSHKRCIIPLVSVSLTHGDRWWYLKPMVCQTSLLSYSVFWPTLCVCPRQYHKTAM